MKILFFTFYFTIFIFHISAATILMPHPEANFDSYLAFSKIHKKSKSFLTFQKNKIQTTQSFSELNQLFQTAQLQYLKGQFNKAIKSYNKIILHKSDFKGNESNHKIIYDVYLKLALLAENNQTQKQWIKKAINYNNNWMPNKKNYSPSFITKYKHIKNSLPLIELQLQVPKKSFILLNGMFIKNKSSLLLRKGAYDLTAILHRSLIQRNLHINEPYTLALTENRSFPKSEKCLNRNKAYSGSPKHLWYINDNCFLKEIKEAHVSTTLNLNPKTKTTKNSKFTKKNWLIFAGVIAATLYINSQTSKQKEKATVKDGF